MKKIILILLVLCSLGACTTVQKDFPTCTTDYDCYQKFGY